MPWSLARRCSQQENSNVHRLVVQGKHRSGEVEQALAGEATDYFPFLVFRFNFLSAIHVFLVCVLPLAHFLTRCLQCWLSSKWPILQGATSWLGVPSICTVVAAGKFCVLLWADWLFCFLLAIVQLLGCLLWLWIVYRHRGHKKSLFVLQKSSCSTVVDSCHSWILPVAGAVLAIHHRGFGAKLFLFFFFSLWRSPCLLFFFSVYFNCSFSVEVCCQYFSSPPQLVLAVVTCCMGGAVVLLGSAAVKLTQ